MHLDIQGRHLDVTPALHAYVKEKSQKIRYYFDHIVHIHVVLSVENKINQVCEVTITAEHHYFHNKKSTEDMYKSVDFVFDAIERQVRKYKEYIQSKHKVRKNREQINKELAGAINYNKEIEIEEIEISPKPMSTLEAVLQMKVDEHQKYLSFFPGEDAVHPSFLIKKRDVGKFDLIYWDHFWEKKEIEFEEPENLRENVVENIKVPSEHLEDVVQFLEHNPETGYRIFRSLRTDSYMFVFREKKHEYGLIREEVVG